MSAKAHLYEGHITYFYFSCFGAGGVQLFTAKYKLNYELLRVLETKQMMPY